MALAIERRNATPYYHIHPRWRPVLLRASGQLVARNRIRRHAGLLASVVRHWNIARQLSHIAQSVRVEDTAGIRSSKQELPRVHPIRWHRMDSLPRSLFRGWKGNGHVLVGVGAVHRT